MKKTHSKQMIQDIFDLADVRVNGSKPWDIQVRNPDFYKRALAGGSLALGESYMDEWWDCEALDQFFDKIMGARLDQKVKKSKTGMINGFIGCGPTIFFPAPVLSDQEGISCGRLCFQKME